MPRRATYKCPKCNSRNIVPIVYGYPGPELMEDSALRKVELGGCVLEEGAPDRHCNDCEYQWMTTDNYSPEIHEKYEDESKRYKECKHCLEPPMYCTCYQDLIDDEEIRRNFENKRRGDDKK